MVKKVILSLLLVPVLVLGFATFVLGKEETVSKEIGTNYLLASADNTTENKTILNDDKITREFSFNFWGIKYIYFDSKGNELNDTALQDFLENHKDTVNSVKVNEGINQMKMGKTLYFVGLGVMIISPLAITTKDNGEVDSSAAWTLLGGGFICSIVGGVQVGNGSKQIDNAVISYNRKVENGALSIIPSFVTQENKLKLTFLYQFK
jgi:hypothetical protein